MKNQTSRWMTPLLAVAFLGTTTLAHAHGWHGSTAAGSPLAHGLLHPVTGLDHILAMVAVGLWAARLGGRMLWALPLTFVSVMILGSVAGIAGLSLPLVESGIAASVLILGLVLATAVKLPKSACFALVGLFAVFHGYAHGVEIAQGVSTIAYIAGFALTTAALHLAGILGGFGLARVRLPESRRDLVIRACGTATCFAGMAMLIGII